MKTGRLQTSVTIGDVLAQNGGLGPGFDFLRVALALSVVAWHSPPIANGAKWLDFTPIVWFPGYGMLVMFFGLSGFLIAGSAQRLKIHDFLINRGLRIFPALILEIMLSAIVLGPLFTKFTTSEYFQSEQTYTYFLNIFGFMHYRLPGVFGSNPSNLVNWSLWTVPYELGCYAIMSSFIIYGALKKPSILLIMIAVYTLVGVAVARLYLDIDTTVGAISNSLLTGRGSRLFIAFVLGIAAYLYRMRIPYDRRLFVLSAAVCFAVSLITPSGWLSEPLLNSVLCAPLIYMMMFIGCTRMPKLLIYSTGDYSYGIYLYGMPIQQAVRAIFPSLTSGAENFAVSVIGITAFAAFSWFCVERPILRMRKRFSFVARARGIEGLGESKVGTPPPIIDEAAGAVLSFRSEQRQSG
jgi:peptidoglycan/LPS O-acetylase OafA/YrhL